MASKESLAVRQGLLEWGAQQAQKQPSIEEMRKSLEDLMSSTPLASDVSINRIQIGETPAEWVTTPTATQNRVFLFLHGGGYFLGSCKAYRDLASRLSEATNSRVLTVEYRLAPEHQYPAAIEDAVSAYRWLVSDQGIDPSQIIIGGDSAGGGLTLATLLSLRDAGDTLPAAAVLLSPWTDMEGTGKSMETRKDVDPWLNPDQSRATPPMYIGNLDRRHPLVSPIYADLQGLPPMLVHVGNDEILLDDSVRLVERAEVAGVDVTFKIFEDMWHVFHAFAASVPEAQEAINEIGNYVTKKLEAIEIT
ncbi:alpha/beta hydrolase [Neobacillus sp. FSL H8-0543]|uniref:alpha/beta hydrolase n=1 Tax=Neobacillus sp. FSL H8-0543 TaxID=2954672 RepID=UPI0031587EF4